MHHRAHDAGDEQQSAPDADLLPPIAPPRRIARHLPLILAPDPPYRAERDTGNNDSEERPREKIEARLKTRRPAFADEERIECADGDDLRYPDGVRARLRLEAKAEEECEET